MNTNALVLEGTISADAIDQAIEHFCRVNKSDRLSFKRHLKAATEEWKKLSTKSWEIDYGQFSTLLPEGKKGAGTRSPKAFRKVRADNPIDQSTQGKLNHPKSGKKTGQ